MVHDPDRQEQDDESQHDVVSVPEKTISSENDKIHGRKLKSLEAIKLASYSYAGPLPPASELNAYEQILPGAAERILAMTEKEQSHRHQSEDSE